MNAQARAVVSTRALARTLILVLLATFLACAAAIGMTPTPAHRVAAGG
jgi:hypothetical protein